MECELYVHGLSLVNYVYIGLVLKLLTQSCSSKYSIDISLRGVSTSLNKTNYGVVSITKSITCLIINYIDVHVCLPNVFGKSCGNTSVNITAHSRLPCCSPSDDSNDSLCLQSAPGIQCYVVAFASLLKRLGSEKQLRRIQGRGGWGLGRAQHADAESHYWSQRTE